MKGRTRAALETWKFVVYLGMPVALVYYFSDPQKLKEGLIKHKFVTYKEEAHMENLLKAPEGYVKKTKNEGNE
eukprot:CAMPEP_0206190656 /NCGR_PEP_ID=MMETSP0166-20121206/4869_1 /ASSEMBLY_ACC=CAM_ASM_000260 /TAXON_ID=95228 /ORGANISM="Vannella robusta, Strain DIVA3 518/3/11/1/6" /LENGTH=72 /DNA_ID=CAMNT_0053606755 /DNA_START=393 /DNA_END=611 /DNA_ORIENTATION=+